MKVGITLADIKVLLAKAKENGNLDAWASMAIQWMEAANDEINRLKSTSERPPESRKEK